MLTPARRLAVFLFFTPLCLDAQQVSTSGANSPAVVAQNFSAVYGVRSDAILAILNVYKKEGLDAAARKKQTEALLKKYQETPEKQGHAVTLSDASKKQLGLNAAPGLAEALDWDLFAQKNQLSTQGNQSPAVVAGGNVSIWYGIPPKALRALANRLEADQTDIAEFEQRLEEQAKKLEELSKSLVNREDEMAREADLLLNEGKIEEAVKVLKDRRYALRMKTERAQKEEALAASDYAGGLELQLKYDSAYVQRKDALKLDPDNSTYLRALATLEYALADYDAAIAHLEKAIGIDTVASRDQPEKAANSYSDLGLIWVTKGEYDRALGFFEKALPVLIRVLGENNTDVAEAYNNMASVHHYKGEIDTALILYQKAVTIDSIILGSNHPDVALRYNNIGVALSDKGEYERAVVYYEKALVIDSINFGIKHPSVAMIFSNLGSAIEEQKKYDRALYFYQKALAIDSAIYGNHHPMVSIRYHNIGNVFINKGDLDQGLYFTQLSLAIDTVVFGSRHPKIANKYNTLANVCNMKGDYDQALAYLDKALPIYIQALGETHTKVAVLYNTYGKAWYGKKEYDRALDFYQKTKDILQLRMPPGHQYITMASTSLSNSANAKGTSLLEQKKYQEALPCFQKALENAEFAENWPLSFTCRSNIGRTLECLKQYADGYAVLESGVSKAREIDRASGKTDNALAICKMRFYEIGCLMGLGKKAEADTLSREVQKEASEAGAGELLEEMRKAGYLKK